MKEIVTSLGYPLRQIKEGWELDLSEMKIYSGLSVLAKVIGEHIMDEAERSSGDVSFCYKVSSNINPELVAMRIHYIQVHARAGVLRDCQEYREDFIRQLITVFGTLQRQKWRIEIFPEENHQKAKADIPISKALVFNFIHEFCDVENRKRFILEKSNNNNAEASFFFRLTIEKIEQETTDLKNIPNVVVDDLATRAYIAGSSKIAGSIREHIVNACSRGLDYYSEENRIYSRLFEQLQNAHLDRLEFINFSWDDCFSKYIQQTEPKKGASALKTIFLALEAYSICEILCNGGAVKVILHECYFTLYLTQLGRSLNISINLPRKIFHMDAYLKRMPMLASIASQTRHNYDFSDTKIFLVHHITSEIIGFIEALRKLKAYSIDVMFVKYSGIIPPVYLDTLLEADSSFLFMAGLEKKTSGKMTDYWTIAGDFSDTAELTDLKLFADHQKLSYFEAMKLVSIHLFLRCCLAAQKQKKKVLLIEDGGYIAPIVNAVGISKENTDAVLERFHVFPGHKIEVPFYQWLKNILIGTIEHTKNGYDRLEALTAHQSRLLFPAYSIATSNLKTLEESQEVAHSILSAVESILHENGLVLSRRNIIVLGAEGNIGKSLCRLLQKGRLHENNQTLTRVDVKFEASGEKGKYGSIGKIPDDELLRKDLFIGVIGKSILEKTQIEKLIIHGAKNDLFFASGSTKTAEFEDLSSWLQTISRLEAPRIEDIPVTIDYGRIYDPQSGFDQGRKVMIRFQKGDRFYKKTLFLLADLSPVNFMYYGVPTEVMDSILSQLLTVSLGMNRQYKSEMLPPAGLYAVDNHIDDWGTLKE